MPQPEYYRPAKITRKFGAIFDNMGNEINERERGLSGQCEGTGKGHKWLIMPDTSSANQEGGKQYILCLECCERGHL